MQSVVQVLDTWLTAPAVTGLHASLVRLATQAGVIPLAAMLALGAFTLRGRSSG